MFHTKVVQKIKTPVFIFSNLSRKSCHLWQCGKIWYSRTCHRWTVWRSRVARSIPIATHTHTHSLTRYM